MKKLIAAVLTSSLLSTAFAADTSITAIFGGGNPDTGWTSSIANDIELGLRAKGRNGTAYANLVPSNNDGSYTFLVQQGSRGAFNYEFSINSNKTGDLPVTPLSAYTFFLGVDTDSSAGVNYSYTDPIFHWIDNSFGLNGTANGGGSEPGDSSTVAADYNAYPTFFNIVQGSQNLNFGDYPGGALPIVANATYSYELFAVAQGGNVNSQRLASVGITVVVGNGGAASVPDSASTALLLVLGGVGMMGYKARRSNRS